MTPELSTSTTRDVAAKDPAASMALIFDAMRNPIDPLYADVARRRSAGEATRHRSRSPLLLVSLVLMGLLFATSALALRVPTTVANDRHAQLVAQVSAKQKANDAATAQVARTRADLAASQSTALTRQSESTLQQELEAAQRMAGLAPVSGAGVVMTLSEPKRGADSADSDPRTSQDAQAITSTDLQQIVNGWWQAGASAVSINGQRVTSMTAIRFAGSAVLVNFRPLVPPYEVTVVGPAGMTDAFDDSFAGAYAQQLNKVGFAVATAARQRVDVPALPGVHLSKATTMPPSR